MEANIIIDFLCVDGIFHSNDPAIKSDKNWGQMWSEIPKRLKWLSGESLSDLCLKSRDSLEYIYCAKFDSSMVCIFTLLFVFNLLRAIYLFYDAYALIE